MKNYYENKILSHGRTRTNTDNFHISPGEASGLMSDCYYNVKLVADPIPIE